MSKMGSYDPFGHQQHKLWPIERPGVKLAIWLPTTGSQKSTQFPCVQVACNMSLENSRRGLQLWLRPRPDWRSAQEFIIPQSCGTPSLGNFGTPNWESRDKKPFGCHSRGVVQSLLYGGRWWLPLNLGRGESCESKVAREVVLTPKVLQPRANQLVCWFSAGLLLVSELLVTLPSPIPQL
jgi:hypothetical protein